MSSLGGEGYLAGMEGEILMRRRERERMRECARVVRGELKVGDAAAILGISKRQCGRVLSRYKARGAAGLVHAARGRPSNRGAPREKREAVLARYEERYEGFGPTLAAEKLERDGFEVYTETLRRWLIEAGKWKRRRRRSSHRSRRERKAHFGELVQMDGSHHRWFEERGAKCCLMDMVDDANNTRLALFSGEETTEAAMRLLWAWIERYGIPLALYVDKKTVFVVDKKSRERAEDEGREALTQFGRACSKLGIRIISANSPEAKGRVERSHRIYQDRLVKELRLEELSTIEDANRLLEGGYMDELNRKFTVEAASEVDYHRSAEGIDLAAVFCIEEERSVTEDWIVRFENRFFQLTPPHKRMRGRGKVTVQRRLDGSLYFDYKGRCLAFVELPARPTPKKKSKKRKDPESIMQKYIPPPDSPWRRFVINPGPPL
jgi:transposase